MGIETTGSGGADTVVRLSLLFFSFRVPSVEIGYLILALVGIGLPFLCWLLYLWVQTDLDAGGRRDPISGQDGAIADYLARLDAGLHLPAGTRRDVVNEIAGHLSQSVATLEAAGASHADAVRQALARLGPAEPLARDLRAAQQTRRRLLAGAGGGVFGATAGLVLGLAYGFLVLLPALVFAIVTPMAIQRFVPGVSAHLGLTADLLGTLLLPIALTVTGRVSTRLMAGLSRREPRAIGRLVAVIGTPIVAAYVLAGLRLEASPLILAAAAIPVGFAGGALTADRAVRWPNRRGRLAIWLGLAAIAVLVPLVVAPPSQEIRVPPAGVDRVAPPAPVTLVPQTAGAGTGMSTDCWFGDTQVECTVLGRVGPAWSDLRMEVWPAEQADWPDGLDPRATAPLMTVPVTIADREITAVVEPGFHRSGNAWWFVLTGVSPDGVRYRLTDGDGDVLDWQPTLLEWLQAPD